MGLAIVTQDWKHQSRLIAWSFQSTRLKFSIQAWKFQSRLKFSNSLEKSTSDLDNSPQKKALCSTRLKISIWDLSPENFNPEGKSWILQSLVGRISNKMFSLEIFADALLRRVAAPDCPTLLSGWYGGKRFHKTILPTPPGHESSNNIPSLLGRCVLGGDSQECDAKIWPSIFQGGETRASVEIQVKPRLFWNFPAHTDFSTLGSPFWAFWGEMKLVCWALLTISWERTDNYHTVSRQSKDNWQTSTRHWTDTCQKIDREVWKISLVARSAWTPCDCQPEKGLTILFDFLIS